ncbi:MAG: hypothetical protein Q8R95_12695 [Azonexus sp.]|nr:hypothetical protein [Azonexus sp.]
MTHAGLDCQYNKRLRADSARHRLLDCIKQSSLFSVEQSPLAAGANARPLDLADRVRQAGHLPFCRCGFECVREQGEVEPDGIFSHPPRTFVIAKFRDVGTADFAQVFFRERLVF